MNHLTLQNIHLSSNEDIYDMDLHREMFLAQYSALNMMIWNEQLSSSQDDITGLLPFMTAAAVKDQPLEFVYKLAMMVDAALIKKEMKRKE